MDLENSGFDEYVAYLLGFVKKHVNPITVDFPDFPLDSNFDYRLTEALMKLAYKVNQTIHSEKVDYIIEALQYEWEG